jgi:RNA polymerase sigma factor (sigma-70 family)
MMMHALGRSTEGEALWRTHAAELVRYATLLVGPGDAQDVVSTAFLNVLGSKVRQAENIRAYLFRAVTNAAIDGQRSSSRRLARDRHAVLPGSVDAPETNVDLRRAIALLPVRLRAVVYFTYWEDMDAMEIAQTLRITPSTVRRDLRAARAELQRSIA